MMIWFVFLSCFLMTKPPGASRARTKSTHGKKLKDYYVGRVKKKEKQMLEFLYCLLRCWSIPTYVLSLCELLYCRLGYAVKWWSSMVLSMTITGLCWHYQGSVAFLLRYIMLGLEFRLLYESFVALDFGWLGQFNSYIRPGIWLVHFVYSKLVGGHLII